MADKELWDAVNDIRRSTAQIDKAVARMEATVQSHIAEPSIHTRPPCEQQKALSKLVYGTLAAAIFALGSALWALVSGK